MEKTLEEPSTRVLEVKQCASLSGRSQITYQIGCRGGNAPYLRVCGNSRKGRYSKEWVATAEIAQVIANTEKLTAAGLSRSLYPGKSTNSGGFLLAVLGDVGLIEVVGERVKTYAQKDGAEFLEAFHKLLDVGVDLPLDARPGVDQKPGRQANRGKRVIAE